MPNDLVSRLELVVNKVLEKNCQLTRECQLLKTEKQAWAKEKEELLADVERALKRLEDLDLEGL